MGIRAAVNDDVVAFTEAGEDFRDLGRRPTGQAERAAFGHIGRADRVLDAVGHEGCDPPRRRALQNRSVQLCRAATRVRGAVALLTPGGKCGP